MIRLKRESSAPPDLVCLLALFLTFASVSCGANSLYLILIAHEGPFFAFLVLLSSGSLLVGTKVRVHVRKFTVSIQYWYFTLLITLREGLRDYSDSRNFGLSLSLMYS